MATKSFPIIILLLSFSIVSCKSSSTKKGTVTNKMGTVTEAENDDDSEYKKVIVYDETGFDPERPLPEDIIEKEKPAIQKSDNKKKTGRKSAVVYTGNEFIRQKKYHPLAGDKVMVMTIRGNARIKRGTTSLHSGVIDVIGDKGHYAETPYSIHVYDYKEKLSIRAGYGIYDKENKKVLLSKKPVANQKDKDGRVTINAYQMEWYIDKKQLKASGNVTIATEDYIMECDSAFWDEPSDRVFLSGNPVIREKESLYKADSMVYHRKEKKANLKENVVFLITESVKENNANTENDEKKKNIVTTKITSNESVIYHGKEIRFGRKISFSSAKDGWVHVVRENFSLRAKDACVWGEDPDEMLAWNFVRIEDQENNTVTFAPMARYQKHFKDSGETIIMESVPGSNFRPQIIRIKDNSNLIDSIFSAHYFERSLEKEKTFARGNVELSYFPKDHPVLLFDPFTEKEKMATLRSMTPGLSSEWAESIDEKELVHFFGSPKLKEKSSEVNASKITYYHEKQTLRMIGPLNGVLKTEE